VPGSEAYDDPHCEAAVNQAIVMKSSRITSLTNIDELKFDQSR
jgi:hypothetical protein